MLKRIALSILLLVIIAGILGGIKYLQIDRMTAQGKASSMPPTTVTVTPVATMDWEVRLSAVGTLNAVQGVTITAELTGKVARIAFEPGAFVDAGVLLVQQDIATETAQLRAAEATLALNRANFDRARELRGEQVVTQAAYDQALANLKQAQAEIDRIKAIISKKTIQAPFAGRLGIRRINLGQVIKDGDPIVSLQSLDPIFVNFLLPQSELARLETGLTVRIRADVLAGETISGRITAINPQVEAETRNIRVQATLRNADEKLRPGMFVNVEVLLPGKKSVLAIPTTAVLYAPYSDSVFLVEAGKAQGDAPPAKHLRQQFVRLGDARGDFVSVLEGLEANQQVVSTGVFKLRNKQKVVVDNKLAPSFQTEPRPDDS
ncbi:MAG: efflux RND transporter periplasmic adaptor subunit [Desulfobacterales bacterium]|nr:efflux RND transporter periplasmic adaptor subunit [Desulfobacterales bacterium]MDJ0888515.1 efflux RND transporter periplasmic adaptor subunit [Desulfobacterales bacterium]